MTPLSFGFKVLTPLWLGGYGGDCERVKESGLIGCLRFWYEGLLRAAGLDVDAERDRLFGSTGHRRAFQFRAYGLTQVALEQLNKNRPTTLGSRLRAGSHVLNSDGEFRIEVTPHYGQDASLVRERIPYLIDRVAKLGGLGAKTQHGFGQVRLVNADAFKDEIAAGKLALPQAGVSVGDRDFTLHDARFFSATWSGEKLPNAINLNLPASVRHAVAAALRLNADSLEGKTLLGYVPQDRNAADKTARGTRIHVSIPFQEALSPKWHVKIWFDSAKRSEIERAIRTHMERSFPGWEIA
jgi:CRISPR type III-B/RAMP module RAMP protein Cmr1